MLRRIWAITQKEFIQLIRSMILPAIIIGPILELILFAVAIHTDVQHIPMVVSDQSLSPASRAYLAAFTSSGSFDLVASVQDQAGAVHDIDSGVANIAIVIPPDFSTGIQQKNAHVLLLVDGSSSFITQSAASSAAAISNQYAVGLVSRQVTPPLQAHMQILYNPDLRDLWFIIPGFGAFLLYGLSLKMTAFSIVREREVGTIEALLVTPIRPIELMLGKAIPNLLVGVINAATVLPIGVLVFHVPFRGSLLLFSALSVLFAVSGLGLGLAISSISQSQLQANQVSSLVNIAGMFVSGFMFPVAGLPLLLRLAGYLLPLTFFIPIVNGIFIKGAGLDSLWGPILALSALTAIIFFVGASAFRQKLD